MRSPSSAWLSRSIWSSHSRLSLCAWAEQTRAEDAATAAGSRINLWDVVMMDLTSPSSVQCVISEPVCSVKK